MVKMKRNHMTAIGGNGMNREEAKRLLGETGISVICRGLEREKLSEWIEALYEGGIRILEVPLSEIGSFYMIKALQKRWGKHMLIGAGNVLDAGDARDAAEAGASFLAVPYADKRIMKYAGKKKLPVMAGAMTPSEAVAAWNAGADWIRLFPASRLGPGYARELVQMLGHIPLVAAGGIHAGNAADYIRAGCKGVSTGEELFMPETGAAQINPELLSARAAALTAVVRDCRES